MTSAAAAIPLRRRNLVVFHLESVSWQAFHAFPESFPHLTALMADARTYRMHFSSATSTQMVLSAFLHANDCEMDAASGLASPVANNRGLFDVLREHGYAVGFLCGSGYPERPILRLLSASLPPLTKTRDFSELLTEFEDRIAAGPFALYVWSQLPHINANLALAGHANGLADLFAGSAAIADNLLGAMVEILRRQGILDDTTIIAYGDHGDDFWTHGFKMGLVHGQEPYTPLVHTPLIIRDAALARGVDNRLVSTVDLGPTAMGLLGIPYDTAFHLSGRSLLAEPRSFAFSQNFTASQPDAPDRDVRKAFAVMDRFHTLQVSSRGLALFDHRLDPANHANLLHLCTLDDQGRIDPSELARPGHEHLETVRHLWLRGGLLQDVFTPLRNALRDWVTAKNDFASGRGAETGNLLDLAAFNRIDETGRDAFLNRSPDLSRAPEAVAPSPGMSFRRRVWLTIRPAVPEPVRRGLRRLRNGSAEK